MLLKTLNTGSYALMINTPTSKVIKATLAFNPYMNFDIITLRPLLIPHNLTFNGNTALLLVTVYNISSYYYFKNCYCINAQYEQYVSLSSSSSSSSSTAYPCPKFNNY